MNELYNRIEEKAREKGLKVGGLCELAGVNRGRLSDLKNGRVQSLHITTITKLANALGTTPDALLNGDGGNRIIHMDLGSRKYNPRLICESLTDKELMEMLSAVTREVQRRSNSKEV